MRAATMVEIAHTTVESRLLDVFDGAQPMSILSGQNASQSPEDDVVRNQNVVQMIDPAHLDGNPILPPCTLKRSLPTADAMRADVGLLP